MTEPTLPRFSLFNTEAQIFHSNCAGKDFQIGVFAIRKANLSEAILRFADLSGADLTDTLLPEKIE